MSDEECVYLGDSVEIVTSFSPGLDLGTWFRSSALPLVRTTALRLLGLTKIFLSPYISCPRMRNELWTLLTPLGASVLTGILVANVRRKRLSQNQPFRGLAF